MRQTGPYDVGGVTPTTRATKPLAVFDLDGTLADSGHRQHFLERKPRDWKGFFAGLRHDPPLDEGVRRAAEAAEACEVVYLTGRPERCRRDTLAWLARHGLPEGRLHMRGDADRRPARAMKLEVLRDLGRRREVHMVVDDDELVCDELERAGFRVVRVSWAGEAQPGASQRGASVMPDAQERDGRT